MAMTQTTAGSLSTPDQDEAAQLDYWLAQLAQQLENKFLQQTTGARARVHIVKGLNGTTDASGYLIVTHGAPFTPRLIQASIHRNAQTIATPISVDNITATQCTVRFMNWGAGNFAANAALNSSLALVCWE